MRPEDCFYLGKIAKVRGLKGELIAALDTDQAEKYDNMESVFVYRDGQLVPFFFEYARLQRGRNLIVKFEDIHNVREAEELLDAPLYLPLNLLPPLEGNEFYYHEVIGFRAVEKERDFSGTIIDIYDQGPQALFVIRTETKEVLIPVTDDFIRNVDRSGKIIELRTPDGLLDLYL